MNTYQALAELLKMKGFVSYAHADYAAFSELQKHLRIIERLLPIKFWSDKRLDAGSFWSEEIASALGEAQVHILLCTTEFFYSDYICDYELPAIENKYAGES